MININNQYLIINQTSNMKIFIVFSVLLIKIAPGFCELDCHKITKSSLCSKFYLKKQSDCVQNIEIVVKNNQLCDKNDMKKCVNIWDICLPQMSTTTIKPTTTIFALPTYYYPHIEEETTT